MKQIESMTIKSAEESKIPLPQTFFPRIIREFDDGADEKPLIYWGQLE